MRVDSSPTPTRGAWTSPGTRQAIRRIALALFLASGGSVASAPSIPLPSGDYLFTHRFSEHPGIESLRLEVRIRGNKIVVVNPVASDPFPAGVLDEGTLMWHAGAGQWIIGHDEADRDLQDVGGCTGGPDVIDLVKRIYWTC